MQFSRQNAILISPSTPVGSSNIVIVARTPGLSICSANLFIFSASSSDYDFLCLCVILHCDRCKAGRSSGHYATHGWNPHARLNSPITKIRNDL